MELRQYAAVIWKWLWLIVLATAIAAGSSYWATRNQPKIYQTSATLMVGQSTQSADVNSGDIYTSQQLAQTYIQMVNRQPVLQATMDALGLGGNWMALKGQVIASGVAGTQLIDIRVIDTEPQRAKLIADEVANQIGTAKPDRARGCRATQASRVRGEASR